jgi:4-amino-4-deoxy-L-arabinose transferase-like glycosyltransferase
MADGLLTQTGYGYFENGEFVPMSSRQPATRWPPGLTAMGAALTILGANPLVVMIALFPIQLAAVYLFFVLALKEYFGLVVASAFSFSALSTVIVLDSYTRLNSESYALVCTALIFWLVLRGPKGEGPGPLVVAGLQLTAACIILTMIRFMGAFLVPAACVLFAILWIRDTKGRLAFVAITGILSALPLLALLWYLGPAPPVPPEPDLAARPDFEYWDVTPAVWIAREWGGYLSSFAEAVVPRAGIVYQHPVLTSALGGVVLGSISLALVLRYRGRFDNKEGWDDWRRLRAPLVAGGLALTGLLVLSVASDHFRTPWAVVYRVSGFVIPLVVIACAGASYLLLPLRYRAICVGFFLLVGIARFGHSWLHQDRIGGTTLLNRHYREVVETVATELRQGFPGAQTLIVHTEGHWESRYLLREIWYAQRHDRNFPWKVSTTERARIPVDNPGQLAKLPPSAVLLVHSDDYRRLSWEGTEGMNGREIRRYATFVLLRSRVSQSSESASL